MTPILSIVVPIYNSADRGLESCIEAILSQDYDNFELILVNDGSTDDSLKICKRKQFADNRIKIINKENHGVSAARNDGIDCAIGEYITFIDSDDIMVPGYLREMMVHAGSSDLVVCDVAQRFIDGTQRRFPVPCGVRSLNNSGDFHELIQSRLVFGPCNKIFKLSLIRHNRIYFPTDIDYGEDRIFCYTYLRYAANYEGIQSTYYNYVIQNGDSLSTKSRPNLFTLEYGQWRMLYELYKDRGALSNEHEIILATELFWMVNDAISRLDEYGNLTINKIKSILSIPELDIVRQYVTQIDANAIIKTMIVNRIAIVLYVIYKIVQICKK